MVKKNMRSVFGIIFDPKIIVLFCLLFLFSIGFFIDFFLNFFTEKDFINEVEHRLSWYKLLDTGKSSYSVQAISKKKIGPHSTTVWSGIVVCRREDVNFDILAEIDVNRKKEAISFELPEVWFAYTDYENLLFIKEDNILWYGFKGSENAQPVVFLDKWDNKVYIIIDGVFSANPRPYEREGKKVRHQ